jgi:hypothetical protein
LHCGCKPKMQKPQKLIKTSMFHFLLFVDTAVSFCLARKA